MEYSCSGVVVSSNHFEPLMAYEVLRKILDIEFNFPKIMLFIIIKINNNCNSVENEGKWKYEREKERRIPMLFKVETRHEKGEGINTSWQ